MKSKVIYNKKGRTIIAQTGKRDNFSTSWTHLLNNDRSEAEHKLYNIVMNPLIDKVIYLVYNSSNLKSSKKNHSYYIYIYNDGHFDIVIDSKILRPDNTSIRFDVEKTKEYITELFNDEIKPFYDTATLCNYHSYEFDNDKMNDKKVDLVLIIIKNINKYDILVIEDILPHISYYDIFDKGIKINYKEFFDHNQQNAKLFLEHNIEEYPIALNELLNEPQYFDVLFELSNVYFEFIDMDYSEYEKIKYKKTFQEVYFNLAHIFISLPNPTNEDRNTILSYLFKAGNSDDVKKLRTRLFFERIGRSDLSMDPPFEINMDFDTIMKLGEHYKD